MKKCNSCGEHKPESEFYASKRLRCKSCIKEQKNNYKERKKSGGVIGRVKSDFDIHSTPEAIWKRHIKAKFGITKDDYDRILEKQNFRCAICGTEKNDTKHGNFSIDHCHTTGKIRGLLCQHCNKGLGFFKDNVDFLQQASKYLLEDSQ